MKWCGLELNRTSIEQRIGLAPVAQQKSVYMDRGLAAYVVAADEETWIQ